MSCAAACVLHDLRYIMLSKNLVPSLLDSSCKIDVLNWRPDSPGRQTVQHSKLTAVSRCCTACCTALVNFIHLSFFFLFTGNLFYSTCTYFTEPVSLRCALSRLYPWYDTGARNGATCTMQDPDSVQLYSLVESIAAFWLPR